MNCNKFWITKLSVSRKKENQLDWHEGDLFPEQLLLYINVYTDIFFTYIIPIQTDQAQGHLQSLPTCCTIL